jgi:preprotein translocase subunit SecF
MATHKPFRELLKPGTNFEFIGKQRLWLTISLLVSLACGAALFINERVHGEAMNWSTDFRGGTEIIFGFQKAGTTEPIEVDPGAVRKAMDDAGHQVEVSDFSWTEAMPDGTERRHGGVILRTAEYGAQSLEAQAKLAEDFRQAFGDRQILRASWSGDNLDVRSTKQITWEEADAFFKKSGQALKPWEPELVERYTTPEEGTGEINQQFSIRGLDAVFETALVEGLGADVDPSVVSVYGVSAKAGEKLKADGIASLFYAIILVMAYLVVRFDIRYAPGAVVAMLHDAIVVVGVFAVTWTEVSLTTVAALLTVVGYSVNDTVIIFDRIRENAEKMKDKNFARVMNLSINETLSRSLLTSVTVFATTLMMNIFGTGLVRNFAFAMNVGVIIGAYSSIFIASPVALWVHNKWYSGPAKQRGFRRPDPTESAFVEGDAEV